MFFICLLLIKPLYEPLKSIKNRFITVLNYSYSNGQLACLNNHIKVLERNAYKFRNFYNFKLRVFV
ncbi:transposase [Enterococcus faecalis]|uniref:transposase n=1 Tax=Enterococcus faecalis TaxID=1351 RepID=UPI00299B9C0A|nr:transposase [Enterococcus faecalis]